MSIIDDNARWEDEDKAMQAILDPDSRRWKHTVKARDLFEQYWQDSDLAAFHKGIEARFARFATHHEDLTEVLLEMRYAAEDNDHRYYEEELLNLLYDWADENRVWVA